MSNLSANALFHFTKKLEYLTSILSNGFYPRYCRERINITENIFDLHIPIVCFCDIPLSHIKEHVGKYGYYGLGMTKNWSQREKLSPIIYIKKDSFISENLKTLQKSMIRESPPDKDLVIAFLNIIRHVKPYDGNFLKDKEYSKMIRFYDEREWRYTPEYNSTIEFAFYESDFPDKDKLKEIISIENGKAEELKIDFEPDDIKYIFVKHVKEFPKLFPLLDRISKEKKVPEGKLISKLISWEQINQDF